MFYRYIYKRNRKKEEKRLVNVSYKIRSRELINVIKDRTLGRVPAIKSYIYMQASVSS